MSLIKNILARFLVADASYPENAVFVDIRNTNERNQGVIEDAVLLPLHDINQQAATLLPDKAQDIVLYCASGIRSAAAKRMMRKLGYNNVFNGINAKHVSQITGKRIIQPK